MRITGGKKRVMENKQEELGKYKVLVMTTIDYQLELYKNTAAKGFDPTSRLEELKAKNHCPFQ